MVPYTSYGNVINEVKQNFYTYLINHLNTDFGDDISRDDIRHILYEVTKGQWTATSKTRKVTETVIENNQQVTKTCYKPVMKSLEDLFAMPSESFLKELDHLCKEVTCSLPNEMNFPVRETSPMKPSEAVRCLSQIAWNVKKEGILDFLKFFAGAVEYVKKANPAYGFQNSAVFMSSVRGGGKTTMLNTLQRIFENAYCKTASCEMPTGRFTDITPFFKNNLVFTPDVQRGAEAFNVNQVMHINRHEEVDCEFKGLQAIRGIARAVWMIASNGELPNSTDNRWVKIPMMDYDLRQCSKEELEMIPKVEQIDGQDWYDEHDSSLNFIFADWQLLLQYLQSLQSLQSLQTNFKLGNKLDTNYKEQIDWSFVKFVNGSNYLLEMLWDLKDSCIDFSRVSTKEICKTLNISEPNYGMLDRILSGFRQHGVCRSLTVNSWEYKKWDLTKVVQMLQSLSSIDELYESDEVFADFSEELKQTQAIWKEIIKALEDFENDPNRKFLKGSDEKLDDSWTVCNKYDKEGAYNKEGDQVCVNKPIEGEVKNRTNTRVHQQNFLFECDDISVKQQVEQIENAPQELKDSLLWTCYTGGKSIHAVVHTNLKDEDMWTETNEYDTGLRKYIHQQLSDKYFGGQADPSGQNASRLARAPNAIRQDEKYPGAKQICLQFNMNAKALDVSQLVADYREEQRLSRTLKELTQTSIPEECRKEPSIHTLKDLEAWNMKAPSKAKQECIEFLNGTLIDWNRSLACVRELRNFGFSDYEIEFEGPANDRWIKSALKATH